MTPPPEYAMVDDFPNEPDETWLDTLLLAFIDFLEWLPWTRSQK